MCEFCGCTDMLACEDGCYWMDDTHTLCSNPCCVGLAVWTQLALGYDRLGELVEVRRG
jgi:hypothetical protein